MEKHLVAGHMAENLIGSEIIKLAWEINARINEGQKIFNLTIGDYNSDIFPIPETLNVLFYRIRLVNRINLVLLQNDFCFCLRFIAFEKNSHK